MSLALPLANVLSKLFPQIGLNGLSFVDTARTYAKWKVWNESTTAEVRFAPVSKKLAVKLFHKARDFERQTRQPGKQDGAIGRNGLAVLHALLFDIINYKTGQLIPSYETIAKRACISVRSVGRALARLKAANVINWIRRAVESTDAAGKFCLVQTTNAYAVLPCSQWFGFFDKRRDPPPPDPSTYGATPPRDLMEEAAEEVRRGAIKTAIGILEADPGDELALALASLGRALHGQNSGNSRRPD